MYRWWSPSGCWRWAWATTPSSRSTSEPKLCSKLGLKEQDGAKWDMDWQALKFNIFTNSKKPGRCPWTVVGTEIRLVKRTDCMQRMDVAIVSLTGLWSLVFKPQTQKIGSQTFKPDVISNVWFRPGNQKTLHGYTLDPYLSQGSHAPNYVLLYQLFYSK